MRSTVQDTVPQSPFYDAVVLTGGSHFLCRRPPLPHSALAASTHRLAQPASLSMRHWSLPAGVRKFYCLWSPATRLEGFQQLHDFCAQRLSERREGVTSYHHQSGLIFDELTADSASVRTILVLTVQVPTEAPRLYMTGVYQDQWVKTPQGWRIKYRVLRP